MPKLNKDVIAHGGACPNGYIFDHNRNNITYGKCISVIDNKVYNKATKKVPKKNAKA
jgi:hypothetical protein